MPSVKTARNLQLAVAGFMQRDPSTFVRTVGNDTWDVLLGAMNNTRLYAERLIDFEYSKVQVTVPNVSVLNGGNLANAVLYGSTTPVSVKKILAPFLPLDDPNTPNFPVDLGTKKSWTDRIKRRFEGARPTDTSDFAFITDAPFQIIQQGNTIAVAPPDTTAFSDATFNVYADAVIWLGDYVDGTENDFMLQFCFDWMMYHTIQELNFFVKEDERVQLSAAMVKDSWEAMVKWNNELVAAAADDIGDLD